MECCRLTSNRSDHNLSAHTKAMVWAATLNLEQNLEFCPSQGQQACGCRCLMTSWGDRTGGRGMIVSGVWIFTKAFLPFFFSRWSKCVDLCSHPRPSVQKRRAEMWSLRFLALLIVHMDLYSVNEIEAVSRVRFIPKYGVLIKTGCPFSGTDHLFDVCTICVSESAMLVLRMNGPWRVSQKNKGKVQL